MASVRICNLHELQCVSDGVAGASRREAVCEWENAKDHSMPLVDCEGCDLSSREHSVGVRHGRMLALMEPCAGCEPVFLLSESLRVRRTLFDKCAYVRLPESPAGKTVSVEHGRMSLEAPRNWREIVSFNRRFFWVLKTIETQKPAKV